MYSFFFHDTMNQEEYEGFVGLAYLRATSNGAQQFLIEVRGEGHSFGGQQWSYNRIVGTNIGKRKVEFTDYVTLPERETIDDDLTEWKEKIASSINTKATNDKSITVQPGKSLATICSEGVLVDPSAISQQ